MERTLVRSSSVVAGPPGAADTHRLEREVARVADDLHPRHSGAGSRRLLDLVISLPVAILTLPVVALVAAVSAWTFRAWPFFVQVRVGLDGRPFRFVKVRSLPTEIPDYIDKYALHHVTSRWSHFIRRTHVDELPQLWHVVSGQMSLVGPRPEMLPLAGRFDARFAAARVGTLPGCTGIWQVSVTNDKLIGEAPEYDLFYLRHASRRLDLWILWRTLLDVLPGDRRIRFPDVPSRFCRLDPAELAHYAGLRLAPAWRSRDHEQPAWAPAAFTAGSHRNEKPTASAVTELAAAESVRSPS